MAKGLELTELHCRLGGQGVVNGVTLSVEPGALFCLLGPSGCGKTTLLRLIGGYLAPEREPPGRIRLGNRDITDAAPERRNVATVFQDYALFPHLSARRNVAFGLEVRGVAAAERARRVDAMLARVGLTADQAARRPAALSGGQRQRVALARALVIGPELLLLDEPLANLDRHLRERMRGELRELQQRAAVTTLLVTHDQEEALALATKVGVMFAGRLLQVGPPDELYQRPQTPFVARFLGDANLLEVERTEEAGQEDAGREHAGGEHAGRRANRGASIHTRGGLELDRAAAPHARPGDLLLARPEGVLVGAAARATGRARDGVIRSAAYLGVDRVLTISVGQGDDGDDGVVVRARVRGNSGDPGTTGTPIPIALDPRLVWRIPQRDPDWLAAIRAVQGSARDEAAASA